MPNRPKRIAYIVGLFPAVTEPWLINQVADLKKRGDHVEVFSLQRGHTEHISDAFSRYHMAELVHYLDMPENLFARVMAAVPKAFHMLFRSPFALARSLNVLKYGRQALSLQLLFWAEPFVGKDFDLYHAHFGTVANKFLDIRYVLGTRQPMVTSFYGQDVSRIFKAKGAGFYDDLKKESSAFIVMSEFMKKGIVEKGFDPQKISVVPIFGIDVDAYPFKERTLQPGETIRLGAVGRFVEKKGFDDLLRALAIVKKTDKKFRCTIIGDGPLRSDLQALTDQLGVGDVVEYPGFMKQEEMIRRFLDMHMYLQPSKTATSGDME